jgi:hypothetical protein
MTMPATKASTTCPNRDLNTLLTVVSSSCLIEMLPTLVIFFVAVAPDHYIAYNF